MKDSRTHHLLRTAGAVCAQYLGGIVSRTLAENHALFPPERTTIRLPEGAADLHVDEGVPGGILQARKIWSATTWCTEERAWWTTERGGHRLKIRGDRHQTLVQRRGHDSSTYG